MTWRTQSRWVLSEIVVPLLAAFIGGAVAIWAMFEERRITARPIQFQMFLTAAPKLNALQPQCPAQGNTGYYGFQNVIVRSYVASNGEQIGYYIYSTDIPLDLWYQHPIIDFNSRQPIVLRTSATERDQSNQELRFTVELRVKCLDRSKLGPNHDPNFGGHGTGYTGSLDLPTFKIGDVLKANSLSRSGTVIAVDPQGNASESIEMPFTIYASVGDTR